MANTTDGGTALAEIACKTVQANGSDSLSVPRVPYPMVGPMSNSLPTTPGMTAEAQSPSASTGFDRESFRSGFRYPAASELGSPEAESRLFVDSVSGRVRSRVTVPAPWTVCYQFFVMASAIETFTVLALIAGQERFIVEGQRCLLLRFCLYFSVYFPFM
jgi:hypothetical protein